jgi:EAL domain-containing protein (putative c-di-GMP-specific phosphodiesterase class I)/CheY-like chemotaxis protein
MRTPAQHSSSGVVLVVDDDDVVRFVVSEALTAAGHDVETAADGAQALEALGRRTFDAVVSDIAMPNLTGVELLQRIRALDFDLPVILLTGRPSMETAIEAVESGALRYLQKPVSTAQIQETVATAVRLCQLARWKREALAFLGGHHLVADRAALEWALAEALQAPWLAAQPIVRARDGSCFGHELLLRPSGARLPTPTAALEAAERLCRVPEVGRVVRRLAAATPTAPGTSLFVNVHTLELADEELYAAEAPLSRRARDVVLEITERGSLESVVDLDGHIRALRALGYRVAIDDLGAGYAALNSFAALQPDVAKLDMTLVRGVDADPYRRKLISSVTTMCRDLGILVVAEGIETRAEREVLVDLECDLLQGFAIGRPGPSPAASPS